ncbi:MAG: Type 1 glutamine amidotransferase-like domain-containing protein [Patescibacteria group bacterium]
MDTMNKSGIMLLTSTGLSSKNVYDKFVEIKSSKDLEKAVMITTASTDKENNQYNQMGLSQLKSAGIEVVDFYDFENDELKDLSSYDVIYVCGGNTFKLMKFAREANFDKDVKSLLERGGVYIGVSAGSLIVGSSIQIANEVHPDKNEVALTDFSGFNITNLIIFPHYSLDIEEEIKSFENTNNVKIERVGNSQAILVENGEKALV